MAWYSKLLHAVCKLQAAFEHGLALLPITHIIAPHQAGVDGAPESRVFLLATTLRSPPVEVYIRCDIDGEFLVDEGCLAAARLQLSIGFVQWIDVAMWLLATGPGHVWNQLS